MKIAFFGTSEFGIPTLEELHQTFSVEFIVTNPPRPANRGKKLMDTPVFECAKKLGIKKVYTPEKLTQDFEQQEFAKHLAEIDYGVVVSYGKILPESIIKAVKKRFLNLHPSSLPLFRGAAPIERTLEAGHQKTDICVIEMVKQLDAGDVLARQNYDISDEENALDLHREFAKIGAQLICDVIQNGGIVHERQDETMATYAHKIIKSELELPLQSSGGVQTVLNKIRAFASYGHCFVCHNGKRFKIIKAAAVDKRKTPIDIQCNDGFVTPLVIRPEGKGDLKISDYQF
jgi:methionyl-tRNA formyltransferase